MATSNLSSTTNDLFVETFPPFLDLPDYLFTGSEENIHSSDDLTVSYLVTGHYIVYQIVYCMLPANHPDSLNYLVYDIDALVEQRRKVYKIFAKDKTELTLGEATYDIGILFSGGRVFSDTHFIEMYLKRK